jgi:hypothetical protein
MTRKSFDQAVAEWLRLRPAGAVVEWTDDAIGDEHWAAGWVDVYVPGMCQDLCMNWAWTIVAPNDNGEPTKGVAEWTLRVEPDIELWILSVGGLPELTVEEPAGLTAAALSPRTRQSLGLATEASLDDQAWHPVRGWRLSTLDAGLRDWCATHAGRHDIVFRHNPKVLTPQAAALQAHIDRVAEGVEEEYEIGTAQDGRKIIATGKVMDILLSMDTDDAARTTRTIKRLGDVDEE